MITQIKKILLVAVCLTFVLSACNKNKKLNKSLDGIWLTTYINGVPVTMADDPIQYQFSKSNKDGGNVSITYFDNKSVDDEYKGTYKITNDGKTITIDASATPGSKTDPDSKIHLVDAISNKTDKKFTIEETSEERRGFIFTDIFILEKQ